MSYNISVEKTKQVKGLLPILKSRWDDQTFLPLSTGHYYKSNSAYAIVLPTHPLVGASGWSNQYYDLGTRNLGVQVGRWMPSFIRGVIHDTAGDCDFAGVIWPGSTMVAGVKRDLSAPGFSRLETPLSEVSEVEFLLPPQEDDPLHYLMAAFFVQLESKNCAVILSFDDTEDNTGIVQKAAAWVVDNLNDAGVSQMSDYYSWKRSSAKVAVYPVFNTTVSTTIASIPDNTDIHQIAIGEVNSAIASFKEGEVVPLKARVTKAEDQIGQLIVGDNTRFVSR